MKQAAVQFDSNTRQFQHVELPIAGIKENEVLVKVTCCTICGSDLHTYSGRRNAPDQCVLGHEIVGTVADWGAGAPPTDYLGQPIERGQRITWNMAVGCGDCFFCNHQLSQKCESLFKYGHESCAETPTGGLSEYCLLVPPTSLFKIPDALPDHVVCPANCAGATVAAAIRLAEETHQLQASTALIIGTGMLGLNAVAQLKAKGVANVIVIEPQPKRRELALQFGATDCFESHDDHFLDATRQRTDGRGPDMAFDFSGVNSVIQQGIDHVRIGGLVILVGSVFPTDTLSVSPEQLVRRSLTLRGLHNYLPEDLQTALTFLERHHQDLPFDALVERSFPLSEVESAFEFAQQEKPIRVAVLPTQDAT